MNTMYTEKLEALFANEAFKEKMKNVKSIEEMQKLFDDHGVNFSIEELTQYLESCEELVSQANGELDDEQMGNVVGGIYLRKPLPMNPITPILPIINRAIRSLLKK